MPKMESFFKISITQFVLLMLVWSVSGVLLFFFFNWSTNFSPFSLIFFTFRTEAIFFIISLKGNIKLTFFPFEGWTLKTENEHMALNTSTRCSVPLSYGWQMLSRYGSVKECCKIIIQIHCQPQHFAYDQTFA